MRDVYSIRAVGSPRLTTHARWKRALKRALVFAVRRRLIRWPEFAGLLVCVLHILPLAGEGDSSRAVYSGNQRETYGCLWKPAENSLLGIHMKTGSLSHSVITNAQTGGSGNGALGAA